jgi:hypothetical protein
MVTGLAAAPPACGCLLKLLTFFGFLLGPGRRLA